MPDTYTAPKWLVAAAEALSRAERGLALTGAGISVESGIPDFRSDGGLWQTFPPERFATLPAFRTDPQRVWRMLHAMHALVSTAAPNPGHLALAEMEHWGLIRGVVTQNVDGLHQRAGSRNVIEVHGSSRGLHCIHCGWRDKHAVPLPDETPTCPRCGVPTKPPVILFEESMPAGPTRSATHLAATSDVMLVIGTSLQVWPVAGLPAIAAANGATIIEINASPGAMRKLDVIKLARPAGQVLPALLHQAQKLQASR